MTFRAYLTDHIVSFIIIALAIAFQAIVLSVCHISSDLILCTTIVLMAAVAIAYAVTYFTRRAFYQTLSHTLDEIDQPTLASELLNRPGFSEGALYYDALAKSMKAMNDEIARYRTSSREYREYIELWIHEVKTPIAAADLIIENNPSDTTAAIGQEIYEIEALTEQALYYARSSSVENDYQICEVSLETLVQDALRHNARVLLDADAHIQLEHLEGRVLTDPKWMEFVLTQVLVNAAKYRKPNTPATIQISSQTTSTGLDREATVLSITDFGIGIPSADLPRVFDKGFTGTAGRYFTRSTGIGLYLCQKLCSKMGIGIHITSHVGENTQVSIVFPINHMRDIEGDASI